MGTANRCYPVATQSDVFMVSMLRMYRVGKVCSCIEPIMTFILTAISGSSAQSRYSSDSHCTSLCLL